jgi:hypothetical protein
MYQSTRSICVYFDITAEDRVPPPLPGWLHDDVACA